MTNPFFAYVGLGPGPEFLPYFFALLSLLAAAGIAVLQWPMMLLVRCLARLRHTRRQPPQNWLTSPDAPEGIADVPRSICETPGNGRDDG